VSFLRCHLDGIPLHHQWNKRRERERNTIATRERLVYRDARNRSKVAAAKRIWRRDARAHADCSARLIFSLLSD